LNFYQPSDQSDQHIQEINIDNDNNPDDDSGEIIYTQKDNLKEEQQLKR